MWSVIVDLLHISIHTPRMGSDSQSASDPKALRKYFNPRSPDGERPDTLSNFPFSSIFQSTLPGWGATLHGLRGVLAVAISIHAPRMGSDAAVGSVCPGFLGISIHAPRMGSNRGWAEILDQCLCISIHAPRMGSDQVRLVSRQSLKDFNPRSPDGERPNQLLTNPSSQGISIHAPRMGSDAGLALGGDTWPHISILAPRMGSDAPSTCSRRQDENFNPRSPDGERLARCSSRRRPSKFQSTLPGWGATIRTSTT